jgi:hypothetical protein
MRAVTRCQKDIRHNRRDRQQSLCLGRGSTEQLYRGMPDKRGMLAPNVDLGFSSRPYGQRSSGLPNVLKDSAWLVVGIAGSMNQSGGGRGLELAGGEGQGSRGGRAQVPLETEHSAKRTASGFPAELESDNSRARDKTDKNVSGTRGAMHARLSRCGYTYNAQTMGRRTTNRCWQVSQTRNREASSC